MFRIPSFSLCLTLLAACGAEQSLTVDPGGSRNVSQGGAKDIARFRSIVEQGQVPAPATLDEIGFFAEHAIDLPPAGCGRSICLHPMLAVAPRFNGANWTMAFVAMNSPLDPESIPRPAAHVIVMIEQNEETYGYRQAIRSGIFALAAALRPEDRITVARYGTGVQQLVRGLEPSRISELETAFSEAPSLGVTGTSIYDALATAGQLAELRSSAGVARILLITSGRATTGITDHARITALAESIAERGASVGVLGFGEGFDDTLPLKLGEIGAGSYAYAEHRDDLTALLRQEGETSLFPLARELTLVVRAAPGYRIGRVYGAARAKVFADRAELYAPALFLGHRTGSKDVKNGRRGGGGGLFVELIADAAAGREIGPNAPAFTLDARWIDAAEWEGVSERIEVANVLPPGENPPGMWPHFSDPNRGKVFMMLNMYLALRAAVGFYDSGDCSRALGVIEMMQPSIEAWQAEYRDPDIEADWSLLMSLERNLEAVCRSKTALPPANFHGSCFFI